MLADDVALSNLSISRRPWCIQRLEYRPSEGNPRANNATLRMGMGLKWWRLNFSSSGGLSFCNDRRTVFASMLSTGCGHEDGFNKTCTTSVYVLSKKLVYLGFDVQFLYQSLMTSAYGLCFISVSSALITPPTVHMRSLSRKYCTPLSNTLLSIFPVTDRWIAWLSTVAAILSKLRGLVDLSRLDQRP